MAKARPKTLVSNDEFEFPAVLTIDDLSLAEAEGLRLGFLMYDVSRLRRLAFDKQMRPLGVTRSQWWVVAQLARQEGVTQTELATLLEIGKVALGALVDKLEESGWVERRSDPADRRAKRIFLTDAAHRLIADMQAAARHHNKDVLKGFTAAERRMLVDMLSRLRKNLRQSLSGDEP